MKQVRISGALDKYAFPVGFGPGVDATFHRVLQLEYANLLCFEYLILHSILYCTNSSL